LQALLHALAGGDGGAALRAVAAAFDSGADPRQLLREASRLCRAAEFAALGHLEGADVAPEEAELAVVLARVAPAGFWLRALELLQAAELELRQPVDARLQVEFCVMRLVRETTLGEAQLAALEARVAHLEGGAPAAPRSVATGPQPSAPVPAPAPAPVEPAVAPLAPAPAPPMPSGAEPAPAAQADGRAGTAFTDAESWQQQWPALLDAVNRRDRALAGVLRDCRAVAADSSSLTIGAPYNFHLEKLNDRARLVLLTEAAGEVAGSPRVVDTKYVGEGAAPAKRPGGTGEATQAVLDAFAGSRVTSTRLREDADRPSRGGAA
jgi:DNA polymerase III gamma/tau subunit